MREEALQITAESFSSISKVLCCNTEQVVVFVTPQPVSPQTQTPILHSIFEPKSMIINPSKELTIQLRV